MDKACTHECVRRQEEFLRISELYTNLMKQKKIFDENIAGFLAMYNAAE